MASALRRKRLPAAQSRPVEKSSVHGLSGCALAMAQNDTSTKASRPLGIGATLPEKAPRQIYNAAREATGMTLQDLILAAGGFVHGAHVVEAELARMATLSDANGAGNVPVMA